MAAGASGRGGARLSWVQGSGLPSLPCHLGLVGLMLLGGRGFLGLPGLLRAPCEHVIDPGKEQIWDSDWGQRASGAQWWSLRGAGSVLVSVWGPAPGRSQLPGSGNSGAGGLFGAPPPFPEPWQEAPCYSLPSSWGPTLSSVRPGWPPAAAWVPSLLSPGLCPPISPGGWTGTTLCRAPCWGHSSCIRTQEGGSPWPEEQLSSKGA